MKDTIRKVGVGKIKMDNLTQTRAYTYLHETLHHEVVSNPWSKYQSFSFPTPSSHHETFQDRYANRR
jgi:hypothetical protein